MTVVQIMEKIETSPESALEILPQAAIQLDAIKFFAALTAVFQKVQDKDKRESVLAAIIRKAREVGDFTTSNTTELSEAFLISVAKLGKFFSESDFSLPSIKNLMVSLETLWKFMREYERIIESWEKKETTVN
jgi:hypothetical protein